MSQRIFISRSSRYAEAGWHVIFGASKNNQQATADMGERHNIEFDRNMWYEINHRSLRQSFSYPPWLIFTARCYASAVLVMGLCPCLCVSHTSRCSTKTAKRRITQTTPHDSPGILVFGRQRSPPNSIGVTPYGAPNYEDYGDFRQITG